MDFNQSMAVVQDIWSYGKGEWAFLPVRLSTGQWLERPIRRGSSFWELEKYWGVADMYFSPLTFNSPRRLNATAVDPGVLYADLDGWAFESRVKDRNWMFWWETSPGNSQAVWRLDGTLGLDLFARMNQELTRVLSADSGGWHASKVLRLPGSPNMKRGGVVGRLSAHPGVQWRDAYAVLGRRNESPPRDFAHGDQVPRKLSELERLRLVQEHWSRLTLSQRYWLALAPDKFRVLGKVDRSALLAADLIPGLLRTTEDPVLTFQLLSGAPFDKFSERPHELWNQIQKRRGDLRPQVR